MRPSFSSRLLFRPPSRRSSRAILLAALPVAIATTVGLAWAIVHHERYSTDSPMHSIDAYRFGPDDHLTFVDHFRGRGIAEINCVAFWLQPWGEPPAAETLRVYPSTSGPRYPTWAVLGGDPAPQWNVRAAGWPMLALAGAELTTFDKDAFSGNIRMVYEYRSCLGPKGSYGVAAHRVLPIRPIFMGLIIDIAFWWALWAAAGLAIAALIRTFRTRRRARQGRCPACGYALAGLPSPLCPECGASNVARPSRAVSRPITSRQS